jgi:alkylation response protein AidB-like acyl-CoA dehydrogenase
MLSEEQNLIQKRTYEFALRELEPLAKECDREETFPKELVKKASQAGLIGSFIPREYGGPGLGFLEVTLIAEQLSRVDMGLGMSAVLAPTFGSENILFFGTEEQKKKYFPLLLKGDLLSAGAFTEPDAGTDLSSSTTTALRDGNEYVINGSKIFITNGTICDYMVTLCVTHPEEGKKHRRHSLILIEANRKGVTRDKLKGKMGIRATDTGTIYFNDVRVPRENLIGEEGKGFYQVMHFFDVTRTMIAAQGVGLSQGALDKTLSFLSGVKSVGEPFASCLEQPLVSNQVIQFLIAEMATRIELARTLTYRAAWHIDYGKIDSTLNAMAKYYAGETAVWVCDTAMRIHHICGYMDQTDIERFNRNAKIIEIYEGTKEAEKMVIARRFT